MNFAESQRNPGKHPTGLIIVVIMHVLLAYALVSGLAKKVVDKVMVTETKVVDAPPPPPPPPPKDLPPPPKNLPPPVRKIGIAAVARIRPVDCDVGLDACRPLAQHDHAIGQEQRLLCVVRDQQRGEFVALPERDELGLHGDAGQ